MFINAIQNPQTVKSLFKQENTTFFFKHQNQGKKKKKKEANTTRKIVYNQWASS